MKKKTFAALVLALVMLTLLVAPVMAQGMEPQPDPQLSAEQVVIVGLVATGLLNVLRLVYEFAAKRKVVIPELVTQALVLVIAIGLSLLWFPLALPPFPVLGGLEAPDMIQAVINWSYAFLMALGGMFAVSHFIYKLLVKRLKDDLGGLLIPSVYAPVVKTVRTFDKYDRPE